jgi:hypothetical protein
LAELLCAGVAVIAVGVCEAAAGDVGESADIVRAQGLLALVGRGAVCVGIAARGGTLANQLASSGSTRLGYAVVGGACEAILTVKGSSATLICICVDALVGGRVARIDSAGVIVVAFGIDLAAATTDGSVDAHVFNTLVQGARVMVITILCATGFRVGDRDALHGGVGQWETAGHARFECAGVSIEITIRVTCTTSIWIVYGDKWPPLRRFARMVGEIALGGGADASAGRGAIAIIIAASVEFLILSAEPVCTAR